MLKERKFYRDGTSGPCNSSQSQKSVQKKGNIFLNKKKPDLVESLLHFKLEDVRMDHFSTLRLTRDSEFVCWSCVCVSSCMCTFLLLQIQFFICIRLVRPDIMLISCRKRFRAVPALHLQRRNK